MAKVDRFEDLQIWQQAVQVAIDVYKVSESANIKNDFGTKDQIRRSALSISSNIAEGFEYFIRFLKYAKGSAGELRSQLFVLKETGYIAADYYQEKYEGLLMLSKQLAAFINYLKEYQKEK